MKNLYFLAFAFFFVTISNAQVITFTDPVFKAKLLESSPGNFIARDLSGDYFSIDSNTNNEIEVSEALAVGYLEIGGYAITSLEGIQNFTNLVYLLCENNQITSLNVSPFLFLTNLNCSNNLLTTLTMSGLTELQYLDCQFNQLTSLNLDGVTNLIDLDCSYNNLGTLSLNLLENLEILNCSNNLLVSLNVTDLITLETFDCSYNQLITLDTTGLTSLESFNCSTNLLTSLSFTGFINFTNLDCSNNQLTALNLFGLSNLLDLNCSFNSLQLLNLTDVTNLKNLRCTDNQFSFLNLNGLSQLENAYCANNQISTLNLIGLTQLITLNCDSNQLTNIDLSSLPNLKYLYCNVNALTTLNATGLNMLLVISCLNNQITSLNLANTNAIQALYCSNNQLTTLDVRNLNNLQSLFTSANLLTSLLIKNGSFESNLLISGNPTLEYICADESEINFVQDEINANNYTNCHVNSYCSFGPGGTTYTVQGNAKFDSTSNGCSILDGNFPNLQLDFNDGNNTEYSIFNSNGNYSKSLSIGSYTVTPFIENPTYFSITPSTFSANFPSTASPLNQDFCVTPNGTHADIEITLLPLTNALPGLDAVYKIIYKNKGTITQSGTIVLNFDEAILDVISSNPMVTSQSNGSLNWSFTNLTPLESRSIVLTLNINSSSETPSVTSGQQLNYTALVTTTTTDETPNDNISKFVQTVISSDENYTKTCTEGATVTPSQVGSYVHYSIRFKNTGTEVAQNIVVKDVIDTTKFDVSTLIPIDGSHLYETRISELNKVEFIFKNINLPFTNPNNQGYVAFKIKTLPTLNTGDTFTNTSSIYFDYEAPKESNVASTIIQVLTTTELEFSETFSVSPNPVKNLLSLTHPNDIVITSFRIYTTLGQLIQVTVNPQNSSVDVSNLTSGVYILNLTSEKGSESIKFIKE